MLILQKHLCSPVFGKCLPKRKRTSGSLETKPILKEALIYTESNFQIQFTKFQELPRYHLISRQREKQVSSTVGHDLMTIPMPKGDLPKRTII
jgi:hypothetical protein